MMLTLAAVIGMLIAGRLAYGAWPWESRKTWYWTRKEIKYLRATGFRGKDDDQKHFTR